jgi:protein-tyrosine kinase
LDTPPPYDKMAPMTEQKNTPALLQPASFTEISRIHRRTLSSKRGSLVVTSARAGEGTSTFAHVMALRSAENGQKTLLIDLNLRDSALSSALNAERRAWRLEERQINEPLLDLVDQIPSTPNLYFMAAPRDENTVHYLRDVGRANYFLTNLERHFDHIVVDTTPVSAVNRQNVDPVLLAAAATRTVLVMMAGITSRERVKQAVTMLEDAGATLEGVLVNDHRNPSLRDELMSMTSLVRLVSPSFADWLRKKILDSEFLA